MDCCILIPHFDIKFAHEFGECILPYAHYGYHLNKLRNGNYLSWGGYSCDEDCSWCGECFNWIEISKEEAEAIVDDPQKNNHD